MPSDSQPDKPLDEDILQCRMDLRNALAATRRVCKNVVTSKEMPLQSPQSLQSIRSEPAKTEEDSLYLKMEPSSPPTEARILPFESIQTKKEIELTEKSEDRPAASVEIDALRQTAEQLEQRIQDERHKSSQLEQLAEQLRFSMADREADIHLVRNDLARRNEQFADAQRRLDNSAHTIEQQRLRIDELEIELAEKIGELTVLRQQADETAAEWAKTIESLKAAQDSAARTLEQRQAELDALRQTLAEAEGRLDNVESENSRLLCEKAELTELLHNAQYRMEQQEEAVSPTFSLEDADDFEEEPEPYCEPAAEEICEDDVHLEQQLNDGAIPTFNLAEQILAEQRKTASARRQGPQGSPAAPAAREGIEQVMRQYISDAGQASSPLPSMPEAAERRRDRFARWQGEMLSGVQQSLLAAIVQKDIRHYCGTDSPDYGIYPAAYGRPMSN